MSARNPDVSRRVAAAVQRLDLPPADRAVIGDIVEHAARFDALPEWLATLIVRAERGV